MNLLFKQEAGSVGRRTRTLSNKNHIQIIRCQEEACKHVCVRACAMSFREDLCPVV